MNTNDHIFKLDIYNLEDSDYSLKNQKIYSTFDKAMIVMKSFITSDAKDVRYDWLDIPLSDLFTYTVTFHKIVYGKTFNYKIVITKTILL